MRAVALTYHAIEPGPEPLCIDPDLFAAHVGEIAASGLPALTASSLAAALDDDEGPERAIAITFDDGFATVVEQAAPVLADAGLAATVFCVAGHLGATNDWPSQPPGAPRRELADPDALTGLAAAGWEIGSHGYRHQPLTRASGEAVEREVAGSRAALERATGAPVRAFAYPYGVVPPRSTRDQVARCYEAAFTATIGTADPESDRFALPRIDAHYLRDPRRLRRALEGGLGGYLATRRAAARVRRAVRPDHRAPARASAATGS